MLARLPTERTTRVDFCA